MIRSSLEKVMWNTSLIQKVYGKIELNRVYFRAKKNFFEIHGAGIVVQHIKALPTQSASRVSAASSPGCPTFDPVSCRCSGKVAEDHQDAWVWTPIWEARGSWLQFVAIVAIWGGIQGMGSFSLSLLSLYIKNKQQLRSRSPRNVRNSVTWGIAAACWGPLGKKPESGARAGD